MFFISVLTFKSFGVVFFFVDEHHKGLVFLHVMARVRRKGGLPVLGAHVR